MPADSLVLRHPAELVELATSYGPSPTFTVQPIEPQLLTEGWRLLPHVGIELCDCYQVISTGERAAQVVAEAVTFTNSRGIAVAIVAIGPGMNRAIRDYPLPAGARLGGAIHLHWQALHYR
ncbi:MAG: hypothetical protein M3464_15555 [Chloroflexota bacterium]|nr:hypothetical protein [Chloroflexota bacterium]